MFPLSLLREKEGAFSFARWLLKAKIHYLHQLKLFVISQLRSVESLVVEEAPPVAVLVPDNCFPFSPISHHILFSAHI